MVIGLFVRPRPSQLLSIYLNHPLSPLMTTLISTSNFTKTIFANSAQTECILYDLVSTVWPPDLPKVRLCPYFAAEKCCF